MAFTSRVEAQWNMGHVIVRGIVRTDMRPWTSRLCLSLMPGLPRPMTHCPRSSLHLVHLMNMVVRRRTVAHFFTGIKHYHVARGIKLHDVRPLTTHEILADLSPGRIMNQVPQPEIRRAAEVVASLGPCVRSSSS